MPAPGRPPGPGRRVGPPREGSGFGRAIVATILEEIAARLGRIGVVGGTAIDAGHIVGTLPIGVARVTVRHNGLDVGTVAVLDFVGPSWYVVADPDGTVVHVGLLGGGLEPREIYARTSSDQLEARTSLEPLFTRPA